MTARFSTRIVPLKLGKALWALGVPVLQANGHSYTGSERETALQIPPECAEIINAWREAVSAKLHPAWKQPAQHPEWAELSEATVLRIAADAWEAGAPSRKLQPLSVFSWKGLISTSSR